MQTNKKDDKREITSYTLVLHKARKDLDLTLNEYCVADTVYHLSNNPKSEIKGWCYATKETLSSWLGVTPQSIWGLLKKLIDKNLVEKNKDDRRYLRTTEKWYNYVVLIRIQNRGQYKESLGNIKKAEIKHKESLGCQHKESLDNIYNKNNNNIKKKYSFKDLKLAKLLYFLIKKENPNWHVQPNYDIWADDIRKIRELDNRTEEQIEFMIKWAQKDAFWHKNILSPAKLRKQFNRLVVEVKSKYKNKSRKIGIVTK